MLPEWRGVWGEMLLHTFSNVSLHDVDDGEAEDAHFSNCVKHKQIVQWFQMLCCSREEVVFICRCCWQWQ